jgi:hypothetical protein
VPITLTEASTEWVGVDDLKLHLNIPDNDPTNDVELDLMLEAAQDAVAGLIGPVLWRTITETRTTSLGSLVLNQFPVLSVSSIQQDSSPLTGWTVDLTTGKVDGLPRNAQVVATYVAGRATVPAAVALATLIIAAHLWDTQRGNSPSALPVDNDLQLTGTFGSSFAIPNRAAELLAHYAKPPGF